MTQTPSDRKVQPATTMLALAEWLLRLAIVAGLYLGSYVEQACTLCRVATGRG